MNPILIKEIKNGLMIITINRPEKLNALNEDVLSALSISLDELENNDESRGAIITGSGEKAFVAGADINGFLKADRHAGKDLSEKGQAVFNKIANHSKPIIAAVNGYALGGGCELAISCHFRMASKNAVFGQPEINLGIIPGYGGTQRLPKLIGKGRAMEIIMTGDHISAEEAYRIGLVNELCDQDDLLGKAVIKMQKIIQKGPIALKNIISAIQASDETPDLGLKREAECFGDSFRGWEMIEGVTAFLEKRKPDFQTKKP